MNNNNKKTYLLGIDPGTTETAYCLCEVVSDLLPLKICQFAKIDNEEMAEVLQIILLHCLKSAEENSNLIVAIEHLESYGMAVGKSTFETAYFIGRLTEICNQAGINVQRIYRHEEKNLICHSMKANDSTIKQALVDRFAKHPEINHGKGNKKEPDYFYGFRADCWSAFGICYTYYLKELLDGLPFQDDGTESIEF